jgi:predicted  nucleic acid-binding Zn-ribbon protein
MFELLAQQATQSTAPPQSITVLTTGLEIIATAIGVGIAAYSLINRYADKIIKQLKEVKSLTDRNNNNIESRSEEIKIKTDGLYGFIDRVQSHHSKAIGETNKKISNLEKDLKTNTELTSSTIERLNQLERLNSQTSQLKESISDIHNNSGEKNG